MKKIKSLAMKVSLLARKYILVEEILGAFFLTAAMMQIFDSTMGRRHLMALLIFIALFTLIRSGIKAFNERRAKFSLWFAIPFGVAFLLGIKVSKGAGLEAFSFLDIPLALSLIIVFWLMSLCALAFMDNHQIGFCDSKNIFFKKKKWLKYSLIIFLCWLPIFLIFFPGAVSVDTAVQIRQAIGEDGWSNWHPVLHTALLALPITIGFNIFGDLTAGIALAVLTQMIVLSLVFGYISEWVIARVPKRFIGLLFIVFFAFCPVIACYSVTPWKDILFSVSLTLLILKTYEMVVTFSREEKVSTKGILLLFALAVLVAFFRNGGILIVAVFGFALIIYYIKMRKLVLLATVLSLGFIAFVQGPAYGWIGISSSPFMESMSIPAQQIGYVAAQGTLSEEEKSELSKYADIDKLASSYVSMNADPAKNSFNYDVVDEDKVGFLRVWADLLRNHFGSFIKAYILHTYSYWYPQGDSWVLDLEHNHEKVWLKQEYSDVPLLGEETRTLVEKIEGHLVDSSWLGWITSVGVLCWSVIYMMIVFLYQRKYYMMIPVSCVLVYIASLMIAAPVPGVFRYVYSLVLILPLFILFGFTEAKKRKSD